MQRRITTAVLASASALAVFSLLTLRSPAARADIVAAYLEGHGGVSSVDNPATAASSGSQIAPGLGFQVGARLLFLEGYFDRTAFGQGASVSRGILGLRAGLGAGDLRLVLRGGGGIITDEGGALTGIQPGLAGRRGVVARGGVALEKRLAPGKLLAGLSLDGEAFSLQDSGAATTRFGASTIVNRTQGTDIFLSLEVKFELGI